MDGLETPKEMLARWDEDPDFSAIRLKFRLWVALERAGFQDIRLRCLPHEAVHCLWRFAFRVGRGYPTSKAVEGRVGEVCRSLGYQMDKDYVAAELAKGRARGVLILRHGGPMPSLPG